MNKCTICNTSISAKSKMCRLCYWKKLGNRDQRGEQNPAWKGGRTLHSRGYIYVRCPNHPTVSTFPYVFEHRLVMEKYLGRYLRLDEVIHHLNGNKADNRLENLSLLSQPEHLKEHNFMLANRPPRKRNSKGQYY